MLYMNTALYVYFFNKDGLFPRTWRSDGCTAVGSKRDVKEVGFTLRLHSWDYPGNGPTRLEILKSVEARLILANLESRSIVET